MMMMMFTFSEKLQNAGIGNFIVDSSYVICDALLLLLAELKAVFALFDKDGDGFITMSEVTNVLLSMGISPSPDSIGEIFQQVDLDGEWSCNCLSFLQCDSTNKIILSVQHLSVKTSTHLVRLNSIYPVCVGEN